MLWLVADLNRSMEPTTHRTLAWVIFLKSALGGHQALFLFVGVLTCRCDIFHRVNLLNAFRDLIHPSLVPSRVCLDFTSPLMRSKEFRRPPRFLLVEFRHFICNVDLCIFALLFGVQFCVDTGIKSVVLTEPDDVTGCTVIQGKLCDELDHTMMILYGLATATTATVVSTEELDPLLAVACWVKEAAVWTTVWIFVATIADVAHTGTLGIRSECPCKGERCGKVETHNSAVELVTTCSEPVCMNLHLLEMTEED
jgi:hypothetical protein